MLTHQLNTYWVKLRINQPDVPCSTFLLNPPTEITLRIALVTYFSIKTGSSAQVLPLVGASFWTAQRIKQNVIRGYCFARYTTADRTNANSASAALNKWIKVLTKNKDNTIHGFRHFLRDRFRAVDIGIELIDEIGGWSRKSVGAQYGDGYSLEKKQEALVKMLGQGGYYHK